MSSGTTKIEMVLNALRSVQDPDLKKDLVTLGMIRDLQVQSNGKATFRVVLTTPACPVKDLLKSQAAAAAMSVPGIESVDITMDAEVKNRLSTTSKGLPGVQHIIAVSSGKGGVGKSTVSVNLATSLALDGARVGLLDADIYGPNIPTMMGVTENPKLTVHPEKGEIFIPPMSHGVKVMSMGFLTQGDQPVIWRGPMLHNILNQFCTRVEWGDLDYLVIDLPPGTGDVQLSLAQMLPLTGTVLVTTPQEIALQDVRKAFHMWEKVKVPVLGVVENMSYFKGDDGKVYRIFGEGGGELLSKKFSTRLLGQMQLLPAIREGGDAGRPIVVRDTDHEAANEFRALAREVAREVAVLNAASEASSLEIGAFH
jgi:ATP-binding protein involved in chromosome partitioning